MAELPRGTVTFLFTDLEGSTRLWERSPEWMPTAYARHDALLRDAVAAHDGVVYKVIGDAIQAAFPTAPRAVAGALAAQRALVGEVWPVAEPIRVRMALHTAAVEPDATGDYRAPELNRLGRLLAAGYGEQVLLSLATAELTRDRLPAGAGLRDLGEHRLTDLYRPEHVFQLTHTALPAEFPPLRTLESRPNNLPLQPTVLIGREREVAAIRALLAREAVRLVTLTGTGGTGKTRLALQVAADLLAGQPDGVWFIPLATVTDPAQVATAIAETFGLREAAGTRLIDTLTNYLREKRLILLLDNFEHLVTGAPLVSDLLAACPDLTVLVTSRTPLQLRGEHEAPVPPLVLPDLSQPSTPEALPQYEAVRLFIERARDVKPDFAVTNANAPAVAAICHRLDGLPLALELAAARIRVLPPVAMLARLEQRLPLLTGGARDLPARQRTLRATIAWSHDLLGPNEQVLFRQLAIFVGGCTLEAAETVASLHDREIDVLDGLELLVVHNLVRQEERAGESWFRMLETIREFGLEQLAAKSETADVQRRHAAYYLALAEAADPGLKGPTPRSWIERVEAEFDNFQAAHAWAIANDATEMSIRLRTTMYRLWFTRRHTKRSA
jgi:predicted ATPase/class 3 adenylate cyclase